MKNKGFTLIELLAVIVILAIIALIATPVILNIIEDARKSAAERSMENIEYAAQLYYSKAKMNNSSGEFGGIRFNCTEGECKFGEGEAAIVLG